MLLLFKFSTCLLLVKKYLIERLKTTHKFNQEKVKLVISYHLDKNQGIKSFSTLEQNIDKQVRCVLLRGKTEVELREGRNRLSLVL